MTERVREALMRLTMCAREECAICKYKDKCGFDFQLETATNAMHIILEALMERPKGKWIPLQGGMLTCSVCGKPRCEEKLRYCYDCGAEMESREE